MAILADSRRQIQHLLRRAGFGYRADELDRYQKLGVAGTVEALLNPARVDDSALMALAHSELTTFALDSTIMEVDRAQKDVLYSLWYMRMAHSERPLAERMTYFWHDHFATSFGKVGKAVLMHQQNETLRTHALGSFGDLLLAVARDPAMLIYLDNRSNVRTRPNENYARELMELHTLGEGNGYTESDIKEAARALTGWRVEGTAAAFNARNHDPGTKMFLGQRAPFDDAGVVSLLASQRGTAEHIADKLVRYFVQPDGNAGLARRAADTYAATNGDMRAVMRTILLSDEMYADAAYRSQIKSPTELLVGAARALEAGTDGKPEASFARRLGQIVYEPPNPAGWTGGPEWINATTIFGRSNYAAELTGLRTKTFKADIPGLFRKYDAISSAAAVVDFALDLLVGGDVDPETRSVLVEHIGGVNHFNFEAAARDGRINGMVYLGLSMPLYQVA